MKTVRMSQSRILLGIRILGLGQVSWDLVRPVRIELLNFAALGVLGQSRDLLDQ